MGNLAGATEKSAVERFWLVVEIPEIAPAQIQLPLLTPGSGNLALIRVKDFLVM